MSKFWVNIFTTQECVVAMFSVRRNADYEQFEVESSTSPVVIVVTESNFNSAIF